MSNNSKRKYLLFSQDDGRPDCEKPCAFFASPEGCKNGSKCRFLHPGVATAATAVKASTAYIPPPAVKSFKAESNYSDNSASVNPVSYYQPTPSNDRPAKEEKKQQVQPVGAASYYQPQASAQPIQPAIPQYVQPVQPVQPMQAYAPQVAKVEQKSHKKRRESEEPAAYFVADSNIATVPIYTPTPVAFNPATPSASTSESKSQKKRRAQDSSDSSSDDESQFLFGVVNHAIQNTQQPVASSTSHSYINMATVSAPAAPVAAAAVRAAAIPAATAALPFVPNDAVMQILSSSGTEHATKGAADRPNRNARRSAVSAPSVPVHVVSAAAKPATTPAIVYPGHKPQLVLGNFASLSWGELVVKTKSSSQYNKDYSFKEADASWIRARPYGDWCSQRQLPPIISIDCEMCETTDPVDGTKCGNALVRLSIVNGLNPDELLFDSLVNPGLPVTDMRTEIHGIKEEQVKNIAFSLRHAQAAIMNLCHEGTIIIGHSVQNDLKALHLVHSNVIDTSYLYNVEIASEPGVSTTMLPSLREISDVVLGVKLLDIHDSVQDARSTANAAAFFLQHGPQPPIVRTRQAVQGVDMTLLVHRIPDSFTEQTIQSLFVAQAFVVPTSVATITGRTSNNSNAGATSPDANSAKGKTTVTFSSKAHADVAFDAISGPNRPDKGNYPQKRVYLKNGGYFCVRKNSL